MEPYSPKITLRTQIKEVEREIMMRQRVYENQVRIRKMKQGEADLLISHMGAVLDTLRFCEKHIEDIRAWAADRERAANV